MQDNRSVIRWLVVVCLLIVSVVVVGGITRLTESGLSIVDWKPFMGVVPPLNQVAWQELFDAYRSHPEYLVLKPGMTLGEFKQIFFWEYLHRLLARTVGLVYLVPFVIFLFRKKVQGALVGKLWIGFYLGGMQGMLGWYMVKSGLVDNPFVSHFRLAAHLGLAFFVLSYLSWLILDLKKEPTDLPANLTPAHKNLVYWSWGVLVLVSVQIIYGAFVAGLNAGYMLNTWPKVMGYWIPQGMGAMEPVLKNLVSNGITVQFIHRWLGFAVAGAAIALIVAALRLGIHRRLGIGLGYLVVSLIFQVIIGVLTLIYITPLVLGVWHQLTATLVLISAVWVVYESGRYRKIA